MTKSLQLAPGFTMPLQAITETFGILAARGAGKSNTAAVMAEEMFGAGLPFVVVDPVGSWFGLRSSADGKSAGLSIPIFGGKHGDFPLGRGSGQELADVVVDQRLSCVIDLSAFESENARKLFLLDFAKRLYSRNEAPLHLFLEEADDYIPQRPMGNEENYLLRAWENIVRRGRSRGLGMTMITQRSAAINKNVLTQVQTLIAMRTTGPQDRDAIAEWVKYHGQSKEILASLASLADGDAWVWSPDFLKLTERVRFRRRRTFDSGATPKASAAARTPTTLATVDRADIEKRMAATIEKAKAEDPKELRRLLLEKDRRIRELERAKPAAAPASPERRVEVPVLKAAVAERFSKALEALPGRLGAAVAPAMAMPERIAVSMGPLLDLTREISAALAKLSGNGHRPAPLPIAVQRAGMAAARAVAPKLARPTLSPSGGPGMQGLPRLQRAILTALAQHPEGLTKRLILIHSGYRASGDVSAAFAELSREGWVEPHAGGLRITNPGIGALGAYEPLPLGDDLRASLLTGGKLKKVEVALLGAICDAYPEPIAKGALLERTGYKASGDVSAAFARLVAFGYVAPTGPSLLRASEALFG